MNIISKKLWILVILLPVLGLATYDLFAGNTEQTLNPKVLRTQEDGGRYYQKIKIENATFDFFERENEIRCSSKLLDFDIYTNKNELSNFRVVLRREPAKYTPAPNDGRQAAAYPATSRTIYDDLDGDTILDTMVKVGPNLHETFILYKNKWVRVGNSKAKWKHKKQVKAINTDQKYIFKAGEWIAIE